MFPEDFDVASLAKYLHLSPGQVEKLANRDQLPGRKVGGQWRFPPAEIHHWMEDRMGLVGDNELAQIEGALKAAAPSGEDHDVTIAGTFHLQTIAIPLAARTRGSVISAMSELMADAGMVWDPQKMTQAVRAREDLHTTAIGNGVALLHPRRPLPGILAEPCLGLGITSQGIPFGGGSMLTDIFFLICSVSDRGHLRTLARLSRLVSDSRFLDNLRQASDAAAALELIAVCEEEIKG